MNNDNNLESGPDSAPDENDLTTEEAVEKLWKAGQITFGDAQAFIARAKIVSQMRPRIAKQEITSFIAKAENEGIITEEQVSHLTEFLLESFLEDLK